MQLIQGFSKFTIEEKRKWVLENVDSDLNLFKNSEFQDKVFQKKFEDFSENTIANFHMPFGVAPNFIINSKKYIVPMVTEESSVVAAAANAAKFWSTKGGFKAKVLSFDKVGHIYFTSSLNFKELNAFFLNIKENILKDISSLEENMKKRDGGVKSLNLKTVKLNEIEEVYKLELIANTCDAMGANFINSILEKIAGTFKVLFEQNFNEKNTLEIIMCILSNYTPNCLVRSEVSCKIKELGVIGGVEAQDFARKFKTAIDLATFDPDRAVTHNKGIMNGVDSLVLATGNDFRAIEASCHAYASRLGRYQSLSAASIENGNFNFSIELPLCLGTVGGLTSLHSMAKFSLDLLDKPSSKELMMITASLGLAQNFGAVKSLVTTGIQKGHMKMHLLNILNQLAATKEQKAQCLEHFKDKVVSFRSVASFLGITNL